MPFSGSTGTSFVSPTSTLSGRGDLVNQHPHHAGEEETLHNTAGPATVTTEMRRGVAMVRNCIEVLVAEFVAVYPTTVTAVLSAAAELGLTPFEITHVHHREALVKEARALASSSSLA